MARVNNLSDFLTDVASAIKTKKGSETAIPAANFDTEILALPSQGVYQTKVITINENGQTVITPDSGYDAMDGVQVTTLVPEKQLQTKTYNFTQNTNIQLLPDSGYDGFDTVTLNINVVDPEYATNLSLSQQILGSVALPYIPLEYIQSTGTQYIDMNTANILVDGCRIEASLSFASPTERQCIFGTEVADPFYRNYLFKTSSGFECGAYNYSNISYSVEVNQVLAIDYSTVKGNNYLKINNSTIWNNKDNNDRALTSSYLFAFHHRFNYAQAFAKMKLYYFKLYNSNNELIRDFIPVKRKSDDEICLYDKVTETFFTNQGTGYFIAGPEAN